MPSNMWPSDHDRYQYDEIHINTVLKIKLPMISRPDSFCIGVIIGWQYFSSIVLVCICGHLTESIRLNEISLKANEPMKLIWYEDTKLYSNFLSYLVNQKTSPNISRVLSPIKQLPSFFYNKGKLMYICHAYSAYLALELCQH